ncbi:MAG TPA: cellulase family glycosylhydrolase, partial [Planctomycetota bacterium]|nr:cellulase family glycosylhydrolase [Planctomycetota bacterium]
MTGSKSVLIGALVLLGAAPQAFQPLRLHPANPHYFEFRGQPTVLITSGEHYGAVINLDFNYIPYLNELQSKGLNNTRTWVGPYCESPNDFGIPKNTLAPAPGRLIAPWARSGTPGYANGGNKFDLTQWDAAYFTRLKDFVAQAGSRGIVVEINLFCPYYGDSMWNLSPLKSSNNVNGVGNLAATQVNTLNNGNVLAVQDAMVQKIVAELKTYDNVYYEVCNEPYFGGVTMEWQNHVVDVIAAAESSFAAKHLISMNWANGSGTVNPVNPKVSIYNFHYAHPPTAVAQNWGLNRVIGDNETGFDGTGDLTYRREGWHFILAGGGLYNNLDYSFTVQKPDGTDSQNAPGGGSPSLRSQLKILKEFIHGFNFVAMTPSNGVVTGGVPGGGEMHCLAQSGEQYAIYLSGGSQASLALSLPANSYQADWVNTKTGAVDKTESFQHAGGGRTLASPGYTDDIALRVVRTGTPPPPPPPPPPPTGATFYRAINLNGPALTIDGNAWEGSGAPNYSTTGSAFENQSVTLSPSTDSSRATMIRSSVWNPAGSNVTMTGVPAGTYRVYLYVWEDNYPVIYDVSLEGQVVQSGYSSGAGGHWDRLGPWTADIADGTIQIACSAGDANLSGLEVWRVNAGGGAGTVLREWWTGIGGTAVTDLTQNPAYPSNPTGSSLETSFEAPTDWAESYGTRMRGILTAPQTGSYTFWIASDDNGELWLSLDENPASK